MEILEAVSRAGHLAEPLKHTKRPVVMGTSVIAIQYADGIMMAADTLGSYGSLARFKDLRPPSTFDNRNGKLCGKLRQQLFNNCSTI